jgi:outer membrane biosynthesis protein TonB
VSTHLRAQLEQARQLLEDAQQRHAEVEYALAHSRKQLEDVQRQDSSLATLNTILEHIRKLEEQESIGLLWGESCTDSQAERNRRRIETALKDYDIRVSSAKQTIKALLYERAELDREISSLVARRTKLQHDLSRIPAENVIQPELTRVFSSQIVLPWSNKRKDAMRLRVIMAAAFIATALLAFIVPRWEIPEPERIEYIEIPERLATLIVKKAPPPPPPPEQQAQEETEQAEAEEPAAEETETSEASKAAEKTGLLAFKQDFAEIIDASAGIKMGSQAAVLTNVPAQRRKPASRSMITSQLEFSGSGASTATVRRTDVITDDNKLKKVEFTHIENPQVAALDSKQLESHSMDPARRSDEEIQVVFDQYKEALYRIYNRELRKNSFLKGKLVLQLTIEPNGKVSKCTVESSDLNSEELEKKIVARVLRFNFGTKKGARPLTISYPINFLPAT